MAEPEAKRRVPDDALLPGGPLALELDGSFFIGVECDVVLDSPRLYEFFNVCPLRPRPKRACGFRRCFTLRRPEPGHRKRHPGAAPVALVMFPAARPFEPEFLKLPDARMCQAVASLRGPSDGDQD